MSKPPAIAKSIVIGVGDSRVGKFIDGHQSRQAGMTLRQIATRLGGTYHDANDRNVPTQLIEDIAGLLPIKQDDAAGRRERSLQRRQRSGEGPVGYHAINGCSEPTGREVALVEPHTCAGILHANRHVALIGKHRDADDRRASGN